VERKKKLNEQNLWEEVLFGLFLSFFFFFFFFFFLPFL